MTFLISFDFLNIKQLSLLPPKCGEGFVVFVFFSLKLIVVGIDKMVGLVVVAVVGYCGIVNMMVVCRFLRVAILLI